VPHRWSCGETATGLCVYTAHLLDQCTPRCALDMSGSYARIFGIQSMLARLRSAEKLARQRLCTALVATSSGPRSRESPGSKLRLSRVVSHTCCHASHCTRHVHEILTVATSSPSARSVQLQATRLSTDIHDTTRAGAAFCSAARKTPSGSCLQNANQWIAAKAHNRSMDAQAAKHGFAGGSSSR
jgi:hypothetical protein